VASFFVSRVDSEVDKRLDEVDDPAAEGLKGKAAIANARLAFAAYREFFAQDRFQDLKGAGGNTQRPLWASTGVKNPDYSDTMYVAELVVANTVNTMPEKTMEAFADHGEVNGDQVNGRADEARQVLDQIEQLGIGYDDVIATLEQEGVDKFVKSWNELLDTVKENLEKAGSKQ
jgi:transaldolase